jgi:hypothetical protein
MCSSLTIDIRGFVLRIVLRLFNQAQVDGYRMPNPEDHAATIRHPYEHRYSRLQPSAKDIGDPVMVRYILRSHVCCVRL